jgi:hypothetical protein
MTGEVNSSWMTGEESGSWMTGGESGSRKTGGESGSRKTGGECCFLKTRLGLSFWRLEKPIESMTVGWKTFSFFTFCYKCNNSPKSCIGI